jgi:hypothetical protein
MIVVAHALSLILALQFAIPDQRSDFVFPPRWEGVDAPWSSYLNDRWNDAIDMYRFALWFHGKPVRVESVADAPNRGA